MLNGRLTLHDITDVEAFTARLLPPRLNPTDREDLHAWLIALAWELSTTTYNPTRGTFSTFAGDALRRRLHDWQRQRNGRTRWQFATHTHVRTIPTIVSWDTEYGGHGGEHRLNQLHTTADGDPSTDSPTDLTRLLRTRGSSEAWDTHTHRPRMPRRAA